MLLRYGTEEQKERWLQPLLDGEIRSCFAMTEPQVSAAAGRGEAPLFRQGLVPPWPSMTVVASRQAVSAVAGGLQELCACLVHMGTLRKV